MPGMVKSVLLTLMAGLMLVVVAACSSLNKQPLTWDSHEWSRSKNEIAGVARAVLTHPRHKYHIAEYSEDPQTGIISFNTAWNDAQARGVVHSGTGVRHRVWVEIEETLVDEEFELYDKGRTPDGGGPPTLPGGGRGLKIVEVDGKRKVLKCRLSLTAEYERNTSIIYAGEPEKGEWEHAGSDAEETQQLLTEIRFELHNLGGVELEMSAQALEAHRKYLRDAYATPEERQQRFWKIREGGETPKPRPEAKE